MNNHKTEDNVSERLKKALHGKNLRRATSWFDFVKIDLYNDPDKYSVIKQKYYMWSESLNTLHERETHSLLQWRNLKEYVKHGLVYVSEHVDDTCLCDKL